MINYDRVVKYVYESQNRVRYSMNGLVISVGTIVIGLIDKALLAGVKIGKVQVNMRDTTYKVPLVKEYIQKVIDKGYAGKKRKMACCK